MVGGRKTNHAVLFYRNTRKGGDTRKRHFKNSCIIHFSCYYLSKLISCSQPQASTVAKGLQATRRFAKVW